MPRRLSPTVSASLPAVDDPETFSPDQPPRAATPVLLPLHRLLFVLLAAAACNKPPPPTEPSCTGSLRIATGIVEHTQRAIAVMEEVLCAAR